TAPLPASSSPVRLSSAVSLTGSQGPCPLPCRPPLALSTRRLPSLLQGPGEPGSPALGSTTKALRLPIRASAVTYGFVSAVHPIPPASCSPQRSCKVGGSFQARALGYRPPDFPVSSCGREWDLSGLQAILPVPLLRSSTPVEPTCPRHLGHVDAAPALRTTKASAIAFR